RRRFYMNIEDMIKNMNPQMLSMAMQQMGNMLSPEQMSQVETAIKSTDKGELNSKLNGLNVNDLKQTLQTNPNLTKTLASNPELMRQINSIFKK
ncbi:MAG: hypothetical protein RR145_01600, partial [Oscillospiraceae bacterium]